MIYTKNKEKYNIGIVGATGLIGTTLLKVLEHSNISIDNLYLFASKKSIGKRVLFRNNEYIVNELTEEYYSLIDIFFFTANNFVSRQHIPKLLKYDCLIIDNSSEFRLNEAVPLIIPTVNFKYFKNQ